MRIKTLLPIIGLIVVSAMISPKQAYAGLPCDACDDIYHQCIADGGTRSECLAQQPAGCYLCPPPLGVSDSVALKEEPAKALPDTHKASSTVMTAPH